MARRPAHRISSDELTTILSCVPQRKITHEDLPEGRVVLLLPRFQWKPMARLMERLGRPHFRVKLDEFGAFVWGQCDGQRTVQQIAAAVGARFAERGEQAPERTAVFFRELASGGMVTLMQPSETPQ